MAAASDEAGADDAFRDANEAWKPEDEDDFGDFAGGKEADQVSAEESAPKEATLEPLPLSDDAEDVALREGVRALLPPDFTDLHAPGEDAQPNIVIEGMRLVEGPSQILVTESMRALHRALQEGSVPSAPLDWRRSYTRRQSLIALGVPINLDEVVEDVLPPLELHIAPPTPAGPTAASTRSSEPPHADTPGSAEPTSWGERRRRELGLVEPVLPMHRVDALRQLSEEDIKLKTQPELRELLREMETLSSQLGEALQYYLTVREAFFSDADVFHGMIRDLVAGASHKQAARAKTDKRAQVGRAPPHSDSGSRPHTPQSR
ncbi:hypothetical protein MNAN1_003491 [Malassezia nana]|uniref:Uncharacterized protein n=1 Tax=Malassezia nana TaxID=180528 RepID=A0AAF0J8W5_9BASI|nr:hypothetical protein MNAN1_003491 [Malassezia nana]